MFYVLACISYGFREKSSTMLGTNPDPAASLEHVERVEALRAYSRKESIRFGAVCKIRAFPRKHSAMITIASSSRTRIQGQTLLYSLFFLFFGLISLSATPGLQNLALNATPSTSFVSGHETLSAIKSGEDPSKETDNNNGAYGNWPHVGTEWVEYRWDKPISTNQIEVYWWRDHRGINLPAKCRLSYWNGTEMVEVPNAIGLGVEPNCYNISHFNEITTSRLRLEFDSQPKFSTGILQWKVIDSGNSPSFPPIVHAGVDRTIFLDKDLNLKGEVKPNYTSLAWSKLSGPGKVTFSSPNALKTSAHFTQTGDYLLELTATSDLPGIGIVKIHVMDPPPKESLEQIYTQPYSIDSKLWNGRLEALVVHWIPHCVNKLSEPNLPEGGLDNFVEADQKLAGKPYHGHVGPPWSDAYVLNTVEAMCNALMLQAPDNDKIVVAQAQMRKTLDEWITIILGAQEPDGYLQTRFTLGTEEERKNGITPPRWKYRGDHEGYVGGYLIDAAIADYLMTQGKDQRLYKAARKLADCWVANIGPAPKRGWFDGHEEMEQALTRLAGFVNQEEGPGKGESYTTLAKFLLDSRRNGADYDQSRLPLIEQAEGVGHAVRAAYCYSAMADVAMQTGDADYAQAVQSIWSNIVNKKYYITGGIGSGQTSEGFGPNYALPNAAYCESCSSCGEVFFQHKLNLAYSDSSYADLLEETLYNALLGSFDLTGDNFTYTNALDSSESRRPWHACPCCVGNIPRTILRLPEFMYAKTRDSLYVNLYLGSTFTISKVAGTDVTIIQKTDYPWDGKLSLTLNPTQPQTFSLHLRIPRHDISGLYHNVPGTETPQELSINGVTQPIQMEKGYAVISREWKQGDKVELTLPLHIQEVQADEKVEADRGKVALRYGPLIYSIESLDQNVELNLKLGSSLSTEWKPDILGGILQIHGKFEDGSPLTAIPYYSRNNRGGRSLVWINSQL